MAAGVDTDTMVPAAAGTVVHRPGCRGRDCPGAKGRGKGGEDAEGEPRPMGTRPAMGTRGGSKRGSGALYMNSPPSMMRGPATDVQLRLVPGLPEPTEAEKRAGGDLPSIP
jgi:hypothetical protein